MKMRKLNVIKWVLLVLAFGCLVRLIITYCVSSNVEMPSKNQAKLDFKQLPAKKPRRDRKKIKIVGALPGSKTEHGWDSFEIFERLKAHDNSALGKDLEKETPGQKVVFLTFDDGPSQTNTPKVLDILKEHEVKATFFVLGSMLESDSGKELLLRTLLEGHAIGNHTYSHEYSNLYPNRTLNLENFKAELQRTREIFEQTFGVDFLTRLVRCPGGAMSWKEMEPLFGYLKENNMVSIDWNVLNGDAEGEKKNADELFEYLKQGVGESEMVVALMHDTYGKEETVKALPRVIEFFKNAGYQFKILV